MVKLDIDHTPIELKVMDLLRADAELRAKIAEFFFEEHYIHP